MIQRPAVCAIDYLDVISKRFKNSLKSRKGGRERLMSSTAPSIISSTSPSIINLDASSSTLVSSNQESIYKAR